MSDVTDILLAEIAENIKTLGLGYQTLDADLTAIAALTGTTGLLKKTAANTWALDTTAYQTLDADLTAIAALTGTSGLLKKTAANTWVLDDLLLTSSTVTLLATNVTTPLANVIKKSDSGIINLNLDLKGYQNYSAGITLATLPDGYRPTSTITIPVVLNSQSVIAFAIYTDGTIKSSYGTLTANWIIGISCTYV